MADDALPMALTQDLVSKSIMTPSQLEVQRMVYLKQDFENSLGWNFKEASSRERLVRLARVLFKEMEYAMTPNEIESTENIIKEFQRLQAETTKIELQYSRMPNQTSGMQVITSSNAQYKGVTDDFLDLAYDFLGTWNAAGVNHGLLGSRIKKQISEFKKVYSALESSNIYYNKFGIPISSETLFYAAHLIMRTYAKWDNIIFFEGKPGVGKDTTADSIFTTMASLDDSHEYTLENIFFKEGRKIIEERITNAAPGTIFKLAEAGNQFGSKKFWDKDQIDLTDVVNWIRNSGLTIGLCWKEALSLDSSLRKNRAISTVSIKHRGTATVKTFNENPYATEAVYTPKYLKNKVVLSTVKASLMQLADPTTLMQIPIYNIDETDWWAKEEAHKNQGKAAFQTVSQAQVQGSIAYVGVFLKTMKGARIIEKSSLENFNLKNATHITLGQVAEHLSKETKTEKKTFIITPTYVLLPPHVQEWLGRLS